jgi:hypothetical protein
MIAEAAFLRFEKRGYPGDSVQDWLGAEAELEDALASYCRSADQAQELSAYRWIRAEVRRILERAEDTVNSDTVKNALAKAVAELRQLGDFLPETVDKASKSVRQEIAGTIEKLGQNWNNFRIRQSELFASWKEKGTHTLNQTTHSFYDWLNRWRNRDGN